MTQRLLVLIGYFLKSFFFSIAGSLMVILSLVYWAVFFPPGQGTPDYENYVILIGAFGAAATFLTTISIASRANRLENYPFITRLASRVEYLVAVLLSALISGAMLQILVAALALIRGPELDAQRLLLFPPLWIALNILAAVLALHASDLVTSGWSRVIVFSLLAILLILNGLSQSSDTWTPTRFGGLTDLLYRYNLQPIADVVEQIDLAISGSAMERVSGLVGYVFWPFEAMLDAVFQGGFTLPQALSPLVLLLYGTILFLLAANLFATKDLGFTE